MLMHFGNRLCTSVSERVDGEGGDFIFVCCCAHNKHIPYTGFQHLLKLHSRSACCTCNNVYFLDSEVWVQISQKTEFEPSHETESSCYNIRISKKCKNSPHYLTINIFMPVCVCYHSLPHPLTELQCPLLVMLGRHKKYIYNIMTTTQGNLLKQHCSL